MNAWLYNPSSYIYVNFSHFAQIKNENCLYLGRRSEYSVPRLRPSSFADNRKLKKKKFPL